MDDQILDSIVFEYLERKEKNAAAIFKLNRGPVLPCLTLHLQIQYSHHRDFFLLFWKYLVR